MRTHTTYTELRRIMRLHNDGLDIKEISEETFISQAEIQRVIDAKSPKKKTRKKKTEAPTPETTE